MTQHTRVSKQVVINPKQFTEYFYKGNRWEQPGVRCPMVTAHSSFFGVFDQQPFTRPKV